MKTNKFATILSDYSLATGEVGKPIGQPEVTEYPSGLEALRALAVALSTPYPPSQGRKFLIRLPDGQEVPFDTAYRAITGESPVYRDNRATLYPKL